VDRAYIAAPQNLHRAAVALALFQQMITRRSVVEHELLSEEEFAAAGDTMERLVFF
jgi:hypothetical protein